MSSECNELTVTSNVTIDDSIVPSDSSLIDLLNEQKTNFEYDKSSTLFNTTGRERNSTGPLKQWLYEHRDHPCKS